MVEFYLILAAVGKANSGMFWRLLLGSVVMLVGGYLGEAGYINATLGFVIGMAGWFYILYEVFSGEAGKAAAKSGNKALVTAFGAMRMIITVGWAIYPLGYVFGYLTGGVDANITIVTSQNEIPTKSSEANKAVSAFAAPDRPIKIGRASCRERV